jgi:hypothetical protein
MQFPQIKILINRIRGISKYQPKLVKMYLKQTQKQKCSNAETGFEFKARPHIAYIDQSDLNKISVRTYLFHSLSGCFSLVPSILSAGAW